MKYTSAEAAKLLRQLNDDLTALQTNEEQSRDFLASLGEDPESVRPEYDYSAMQGRQEELERKIRVLKHALNVFNTTHTVPGFDMTIDQMLVYLPQLSSRKAKLWEMKGRLPKTRESACGGRNGAIIDYRYVNYDLAAVQKDFETAAETLAKAQTALDLVNSTETLELEF